LSTTIDIKPHRGGWQVFEAPGVEPCFVGPKAKENAIGYARERMKSRKGEIRVLNAAGEVEERIGADDSARKL
jgi:hypothetical protein